MTPEGLTEKLKTTCGGLLRSVILYGSAAAGDHAGRRSDYNVLVVLERIGVPELRKLTGVTKQWVKAGNPPVLLFTPKELAESTDVFPVEIADMKDSRRVLFGEDYIRPLSADKGHLRVQLERELRSKLIQLREHYLLAAGNHRRVEELFVRTFSSVLALLRGMLRLYRAQVPLQKMEAARKLAEHVPFQVHVLETIDRLKRGEKVPGLDPDRLFSEYLQALETVASSLDRFQAAHLPKEE